MLSSFLRKTMFFLLGMMSLQAAAQQPGPTLVLHLSLIHI